jgi:hypothetical protein
MSGDLASFFFSVKSYVKAASFVNFSPKSASGCCYVKILRIWKFVFKMF